MLVCLLLAIMRVGFEFTTWHERIRYSGNYGNLPHLSIERSWLQMECEGAIRLLQVLVAAGLRQRESMNLNEAGAGVTRFSLVCNGTCCTPA